MTEEVKCPISGKPMEPVFSGTLLGKYKVTYYFCEESGLLRTEKPYWLDEAYRQVIHDTDTFLVNRNIHHSHILEVILECLGIQNGKFLDVAGGCGLLTRLMRDKGFDCYCVDRYCQNLFAKTFEPGTRFKADALFAFEILEHVENPVQFLRALFNQYGCKTAIFSTSTFAHAIPPKDWPYYSFDSGQHITFYQPHTLALLARALGCKYYMLNSSLHIITDRDISRMKRVLLFNELFRQPYSIYVRLKRRGLSKTADDQLKVKGRLKASQQEAVPEGSPSGVGGFGCKLL